MQGQDEEVLLDRYLSFGGSNVLLPMLMLLRIGALTSST